MVPFDLEYYKPETIEEAVQFIPNLIVSPKEVDIGMTAGNKTKKGNLSLRRFDASIHKEAAIPTLIAFLFKSINSPS
jgi:hypothetical protein